MSAISRPTHHTAAALLAALATALAVVACGGGSTTPTTKKAANQIPPQMRPLIHPCQVLPASAAPPNEQGVRPASCNANGSDSLGDELGNYTYPGEQKPALTIGISRDPQHSVWRVATGWVQRKQARYGPTVAGEPTIYDTGQGGLLVSKSGAYHIAILYFRARGTPVNEQELVKVLRALLPRMPSQ